MAETAAPPPEKTEVKPATEIPKPASAESADQKIRESLGDTFLGKMLNLDEPAVDPAAAKETEGKAKPAAKTPDKAAAPESREAKETPTPAPKKKTKVEIIRAPAPQPQPTVDVAQIATAAATAAVQAQRAVRQEERKEEAESEIPEDVKKLSKFYDELHSINPAKYPKDLTARMARFVTAEIKRAEEWQRSHPDETYDADAEEHAAWYRANQPDIDKDDFDDAKINVKVAERTRDIVKNEVAPKTEQIQREVDRQRLQPVIEAQAKSLGDSILKSIVPDFTGELTGESLKKVADSDPIAVEVAIEVDNAYAGVVTDAGLLWHGAVDYNDKMPTHTASLKILTQFESQLAAVKQSDLVRNGKRWCPLADFKNMNRAQQDGFYTVEYPDFVTYVRDHIAPSEAKRIYGERSSYGKNLVDKLAGKHGWKKADETETAHKNGGSNGSATHVAASPVVIPGAPPPPDGAAAASKPTDALEEFWKSVKGR